MDRHAAARRLCRVLVSGPAAGRNCRRRRTSGCAVLSVLRPAIRRSIPCRWWRWRIPASRLEPPPASSAAGLAICELRTEMFVFFSTVSQSYSSPPPPRPNKNQHSFWIGSAVYPKSVSCIFLQNFLAWFNVEDYTLNSLASIAISCKESMRKQHHSKYYFNFIY